MPFRKKSKVFNRGTQALGKHTSAVSIGVGQYNTELLSAISAGDITVAHLFFDDATNTSNCFISNSVAIPIVNFFKMIDVQHDQTRCLIVTVVAFEFLNKLELPISTVIQSR